MSMADRRPASATLPLLDQVAGNKVIQTYVALADQFTGQLGFTEHGFRHANLVARIAHNILARLGYGPHVAELAAVAGYLHDVGNVISRHNHPQTSALIALPILTEMGMATEDIGLVVSAIGNHEEELGHAVSPVSAAVNIADKSDVHRSLPDPHDDVPAGGGGPRLQVPHDRQRQLAALSSLLDSSRRRTASRCQQPVDW